MLGGIVKRSLAMVCPFAIAKAFGLDAATRPPEYFHRHVAGGAGKAVDSGGGPPYNMLRPGCLVLTEGV